MPAVVEGLAVASPLVVVGIHRRHSGRVRRYGRRRYSATDYPSSSTIAIAFIVSESAGAASRRNTIWVWA